MMKRELSTISVTVAPTLRHGIVPTGCAHDCGSGGGEGQCGSSCGGGCA